MPYKKIKEAHHYPEVGVPFFWPFGYAIKMNEDALALEMKNFKFLQEIGKTEIEKPEPKWASRNKILCLLSTFTLRDFSVNATENEIPTLVLPPYAGHTSIIADFHRKQSLVETLLEHGINRVVVTDWHSATLEMKDYNIDNYLAELHVAVTDLGGRVNLIGLCQGGWMASLYAARFPTQVSSLVIAGAPLDTQAGNGTIKNYANKLPLIFFEEIVVAGGGLLKGDYMLDGFKSMHPQKQFIRKYIELYEHIDDVSYVKRIENFDRWYEYTINLPGNWYLQVVRDLFKKNLFIKGKFVGLGKVLNPKFITCPIYLLAGEKDDITPKEQVFNAEKYFGASEKNIIKDLSEGGHIGLFMGENALKNNWLKICDWLITKNEGQ